MNERDTRAMQSSEIRIVDEMQGRFEAVVVKYGVVDDYGTVFDAGCFAESLAKRMPRITWAHNWSDPIGRYVDFIDTADSLTLIGQLDPFDDVPRARQAWAQLRSGTIDQFSVGFMREDVNEIEGVTHFTKAQLDEAALVLVGAVPGTKLVSMRTAAGVSEVPVDFVIDLARKISEGDITREEADAALDLVATSPPIKKEEVIPDPAIAQAEAEADEVLKHLEEGDI